MDLLLFSFYILIFLFVIGLMRNHKPNIPNQQHKETYRKFVHLLLFF